MSSIDWRRLPIVQQPTYPDSDALERALTRLRALPPLVTAGEVDRLAAEFAAAERGEAFVLQGGDCAETFADCTPTIIANRLRVLLQMSLVLIHGLRQRVVRVGRFAGQYAKPRSADTESRDGVELPSFRGDMINAPEFDAAARAPDPQRLCDAHACSAITLNFVRALIEGGFADLHHPENWDLDWLHSAAAGSRYGETVAAIAGAIDFMEMIAGEPVGNLDRVEFFTSHEALVLDYEDALTRTPPGRDRPYNLACHFPWIGMRTADPGHAHVAYCAGIANPVGVKLGPAMTEQWLEDLARRLNPHNQGGRLVLISRMGASAAREALPPLIEAVQRGGYRALWLCDPMHGNTRTTSDGVKTRSFSDIREELDVTFEIHQALGSRLGGVHLELTGENVTECTGGARELADADLGRAYHSQVDPRLNAEQALQLAMDIANR